MLRVTLLEIKFSIYRHNEFCLFIKVTKICLGRGKKLQLSRLCSYVDFSQTFGTRDIRKLARNFHL